ncbi:sentrin-specific protease 8 [Denticeps clupeoides]|uniref:Ubiquitin-like protease family profile domain-containing protein n=1 Tax=Denticeps clupeoides TaxID=299321 RepID=A0AAY4CHG8_9TELE|nr:sentrin-specific protease 8 [Denticeps clupeoides]
MDPVVLSYHDSLLRRSDVALLRGPHWLNDQVIGFAFEYFAAERFTALSGAACFISPEVTHFIKCATSPQEVATFLAPLELPARRWIFLAVNDNRHHAAAGGSHWSLLLYRADERRFSHYDSQAGCNSPDARRVAGQLESFLLGAGRRVSVVEEPCPAQHNSYDCGMYVICNTELLCESVGTGDTPRLGTDTITQDYITRKRAEWCRLIQSLAGG